MAANLVRYLENGAEHWGVAHGDGITPLAGQYTSTADLIRHGETDWRAAASRSATLPLADVELLAPVTIPARLVCQGANYRQHMIESGMNPDEKTFNMFFEKADCTINQPRGTVTRPAHVDFLDYEIEVALVFRREIMQAVQVTAQNLHEFIFGVTIANDITARDVQLSQMQFFKGKSYRGFCPLGPYLTALDKDDFPYLERLLLRLSVNGEIRQQDSSKNMVFKPAESIQELSTFSNMAPGDVLLTGTPSGCALKVPKPFVRTFLQFLLPEKQFWKAFRKVQSKRSQYLRPGDVMTATIRSDDGRLDLGEQRVTVVQDTCSDATTYEPQRKRATKLQHLVIYVDDLARSQEFYTKLFDLQFSALNHPDSSAAMRLAKQEMHFFSFGHYHHDLCLVKHHRLKMDNRSMMHYSMVARDDHMFDTVVDRLRQMNVPYREGRLLLSARVEPGSRAVCFQDPNNHWIEMLSRG
jgi:2-keto-4-pentenoate hydratase/2-oxohepta-3-ene-1,7-dioic acid hydratase in catechol pathway/catechol 2,3-dioxygenase-like lactoylglutathione lyase family enzyme